MNPKTVFAKKYIWLVWGVLLGALLFKVCYLFSPFQDSLHDDMKSFWSGAYDRVWGNQTSIDQWGHFAPFYKYYILSAILRFTNYLGLLSYALKITIFLNILLYSISSFVFYLIVKRFIISRWILLIALLLYSFSITAISINALVLPDTLVVSFLVFATGIVVLSNLGPLSVLFAGLFLGIVIAAKPYLFIFTPVFILYLFERERWRGLFKIILFTLALILIPLMTINENYYLSGGKVKGLGATGGVNFFMGWGKIRKISSHSPEGNYFIVSPGALGHPHWRVIVTPEPWHHQAHFYKLGCQEILKNPLVLLEKLTWFKELFWGSFGPNLSNPPGGYQKAMLAGQFIMYFMFLSLGIIYFFIKYSDIRTFRFFLLLILSFFLSLYAFGLPERRFLVNIEFLILTIFFVILDKISFLFQVYKKEILIYAIFVFTVFVCLPMVLWVD